MIRHCILLLLLPFTAFGQPALQQKADSIVIDFFGASNFERYIHQDEQPIQSAFNQYCFTYKLMWPELSGKTHLIVFALDANGELAPDDTPRGLLRVNATDTIWTTKKEALRKCKGISHSLKRRTMKLVENLAWEIEGKLNFRGKIYKGRLRVDIPSGRVSRLFAVPWD